MTRGLASIVMSIQVTPSHLLTAPDRLRSMFICISQIYKSTKYIISKFVVIVNRIRNIFL